MCTGAAGEALQFGAPLHGGAPHACHQTDIPCDSQLLGAVLEVFPLRPLTMSPHQQNRIFSMCSVCFQPAAPPCPSTELSPDVPRGLELSRSSVEGVQKLH